MFVADPPEAEVRDRLTARARELATQISSLQAELVAVAHEIDANGWIVDMTTAQWLSWQCGLSPAEGRRVVGLADRLQVLPGLASAFEQGRLSEGTVVAMARVATPENEARLLDTAEVATGAQLQTLLRAFVLVEPPPRLDEDPVPEPDERVSYGPDQDGMWRLSARLRLERGAQVEAALRVAWDEERGQDSTPLDGRITTADALVGLAQSVLGGRARIDGLLPERFLTLVHVEVDGRAVLHGLGAVDDGTADELRCESRVATLTHRNGQPVAITSPTRLATPAQQRALLARDRTCRFPGCGRTHRLKAHHVVHHAHGGPTRLDNLVLLCQTHHTLIHRPGWSLQRAPDSELTFRRPDGTRVLPAVQRPPPGPRPDPPPPDRVGRRCVGTGDRLDRSAASVVIDHWLGERSLARSA